MYIWAIQVAYYKPLTILSDQQISFVVFGEPKAQKRHRSTRTGTGIRNYDPSAADKQDFKWMAYQNKPTTPFEGALRVDISFFFSRPKSHYGTGSKSHVLKPNAPNWHIARPDRDNLDKGVLDALKGVFWKDDSIICSGEISKKYSLNPRVEVTITVL